MPHQKISALIVDDEPLARKRIERLLQGDDSIRVDEVVGTGKEAILQMNSSHFDLVFLDIQLKDMTGFQVLESLNQPRPMVIFVTAFDSYAIEAFEVFALDYLLKPYTEERFYKSLQNAKVTLELGRAKQLKKTVSDLLGSLRTNPQELKTIYKDRIPVPDKNTTRFVSTDEIRCIKASNYYVEIFTEQSKYLLRDSMHNILESLDPKNFIRIHRSSIVNLAHMIELVYSDFGELDVKMSNGELIRVSTGYRQEFLKKIGVK